MMSPEEKKELQRIIDDIPNLDVTVKFATPDEVRPSKQYHVASVN
jgi:hypothetical protein